MCILYSSRKCSFLWLFHCNKRRMRDFFEIISRNTQCFTLNKYMQLLSGAKQILVFVSVMVFLDRRILNYRQEKRHWIWLISIAVYSMNACIMDLLLKKFPLQAFFLEKRSFQPWKIWIIVLYSKYTFIYKNRFLWSILVVEQNHCH